MVRVILKTLRGFEKIVASRVLDEYPSAYVIPRPMNYSGIVFIDGIDPSEASKISELVPEVEKALPIFAETRADPMEIADSALRVAKNYLSEGESFAIRTTRRGKHSFTSVDINILVGAKVKDALGNPVNLDNPEKVIWIEIFGDKAYVSVTRELIKKKPRPNGLLSLLRKISIIQMPYLGDVEASYRMGVRIGRAAQAFEVGELIITPVGIVNAEELQSFLRGIIEGRMSRFEIQKKSYSRQVKLVPIKLMDLFQLVRARYGEVFIATSARGDRIDLDKCSELIKLLKEEKRINVLIGSREGLPTGVFRWSKMVINLCPGITFATEQAIPMVISAIITCLNLIKGKIEK